MDTMDTTTLIIETVHEQFLNIYDALVLSERGILTDIMTIRSKLLQAENSLSILAEQLKARFMKASTFPQKKELTFYGKKHIIKIEEEAERIADRFFWHPNIRLNASDSIITRKGADHDKKDSISNEMVRERMENHLQTEACLAYCSRVGFGTN